MPDFDQNPASSDRHFGHFALQVTPSRAVVFSGHSLAGSSPSLELRAIHLTREDERPADRFADQTPLRLEANQILNAFVFGVE